MRRKRKTILLICLAAVLALLVGCQGGEKPLTTVSQALDNAREKAGVETTVMDSEDLDMLLGIQSDEVAEGALYVASEPLQGDMLALFKAANDAAAEHIRQALENYLTQRISETENYLPDVCALLRQGQVRRDGLRVYMAVSAQRDAVMAALEEGR